MAKKAVKKITRSSGPMKIVCPCCKARFDTASGMKEICAECGRKINIYENESDADEALEGMENGAKEKFSGGGWAVADCSPNAR